MISETSNQPFCPSVSDEYRYLLVDGALCPGGIDWLWNMGLVEAPHPVLKDGQHDALAGIGPILVPLSGNDDLEECWSNGVEPLLRASILYTTLRTDEVIHWLRARSQIQLQDGRVVWFRVGDSAILSRLLTSAVEAPSNFWAGIQRVSINTGTGFQHFDLPELAQKPVVSMKVEPQFRFTEELIAVLEKTAVSPHMEVL